VPRLRAPRLLLPTLVIVVLDFTAIAVGIELRDGFGGAAASYLVAVPLWLALLGSYKRRLTRSIQTDLVPLLGALACPTFVLVFVGTPSADRLLQDSPVVAGLVVIGRVISYQVERSLNRRFGGETTLIVGAGILGCSVSSVLLKHPEYGMVPVGFVDGFPDDGSLPLPLLGDIDSFDEVVRSVGAKRVVVAFGANRESEIVEVLRASAVADVEVHIIPRLFELGVTAVGPGADIVWGFPLQHARRAALRTPAWRTKRALDLTLAATLLLVALPLLALVAIAVKLTSRGPVVFSQSRVGQRGQVVQIYKFRSMRVSGDSETRWGNRSDERVTGVGRFIRASSLDELPQIFNVLKGDMSLVGPRPERPYFADEFDHSVLGYRHRLRVPVGLTGWAQIHGLRGDTSIEERARFDNYYIEHWSLWFDLVILARTAAQVLRETWTALRRKPLER
jgi:exopolysaccharide biosynthesis polyprenyl glycosylphosphotransferase